MLEWEPPPLTELEELVLAAGYPASMGIDEASDNVRRWLRAEIDRRLRETVAPEPVELKCDCGEPVAVSVRYAGKVSAGLVSAPRCFACKSPSRSAQAEAEAVRFVVLLGDSAEELARAVAALS